MGCGGSAEEAPPQQTGGYKPTNYNFDDILAPPVENTIPDNFPTRPPEPVFDGNGGEDEYKEYMRKKVVYDQWENSLTLYNMRLKDGNMEACEAIIQKLQASIDEIDWD